MGSVVTLVDEDEWCKRTVTYDPEQASVIFERLLAFYKKRGYDSESLFQSDPVHIEGPVLLCEIADALFSVKYEEKDAP